MRAIFATVVLALLLWLTQCIRCRFSALPGRRWKWLIGSIAVVVVLYLLRILLAIGPNPLPYYCGVDGPDLVSPDGKTILHIRFNDAGGLHSGNFWTWISVGSRWHIVAQGYSDADTRYGDKVFPVHWVDSSTFQAEFEAHRSDEGPRRVQHVHLR